ncbi:MADS-box protein SOC1-like isoform X3 [Syzygium oleosum]|uniref:MADS-box protein SOC1-like isoform X3 n=1 Tax=Syzygium oleosum TaxID=219896 RepID=UPI0024BA25BA|nr:MADS-box protein SOC1-like isoform X3 [Syzygium oleosum]
MPKSRSSASLREEDFMSSQAPSYESPNSVEASQRSESFVLVDTWLSMQNTIERYRQYAKEDMAKKANMEQYMLHLKHEAVDMARQIELLELSKRKFLGQGLGSCSVNELQEISGQLERSLSIIRANKDQLFKEQIEQLKAKEVFLSEENSRLREKYGEMEKPWQSASSVQPKEAGICSLSSQSSDVETELFIGLPEMRF